MSEIITTVLFLFAVIDPLGSVPVYLEATKKFDKAKKTRVAIRATLIAFSILLFFLFVHLVWQRPTDKYGLATPRRSGIFQKV